jgi:hypothetical protein
MTLGALTYENWLRFIPKIEDIKQANSLELANVSPILTRYYFMPILNPM